MKKLLLMALLIVTVLSMASCGGGKGGEKLNWDDIILGELLPVPPATKCEIHDNTSEDLWIEISGINEKQFADYVTACKEKGFTVDAESDSSYFNAFNSDGYELTVNNYNDELDISLVAPMEMAEIDWPKGIAGQMVPAPKSTVGEYSYEYDDSFFVYIGNTSKADYTEYVNVCTDKGFVVDYDKGEDYYYADNEEGWSLSVCYEGNNIMSVSIDPPSDDSDEETESDAPDTTETKIPETTDTQSPDTTETPVSDTTLPSVTDTTEQQNDGDSIDPEFKAAMDSYENFMNEYVEFMKKYQNNPTDLGLLADYADYMSKYADFVADFSKWENEEMNTAETAYYIDVQARVSKKLLEIAA